MTNKICLIGGSGFIGSSLATLLLKDGCDFLILDKVPSNRFPNVCLSVDVRKKIDSNFLSDVSVIVNLAAEHRDDVSPPSLYDEVNVNGAINVCNLAREKKINCIVFTSSVAVYGFAPIGANEACTISPFNDYGRTKWEAEKIYKAWQAEDSQERTLVIVRPTVVFGEGNRGNVFNLLKLIASGKFLMVGDGLNRKSMAYVENVAAFLKFALSFKAGIHVYNYIDKPDFTMNALVAHVNNLLGKSNKIKFKLPFYLGFLIGVCADIVAKITSKKFSISAVRVKKFCADSVYESAIDSSGFIAPVQLMEAIEKTVRFEFIEGRKAEQIFYSE